MITCKICNKEYSSWLGLGQHVSKSHISKKDYYDKFLKKDKEGFCLNSNCNKETKFIGLNEGYQKYCSHICCNSDPLVKQKKVNTHIEKYGVEHPFQLQEFKQKKMNTCLKKYGVSQPLRSESIREKIRKTCLQKFGFENPMKNEEIKIKNIISCATTSVYYLKKYPWVFPEIEKIRDNNGKIEVICKKCGKWFNPNSDQIRNRVGALGSEGNDGSYFYCSDECKNVCPLYGLNPIQFLNSFSGEELYTSQEYEIFKNEVLERQRKEFGYNFCELCESRELLHVHHEKPQKTNPLMVLDPDNGIILCSNCHLSKIHKGECSGANLANILNKC